MHTLVHLVKYLLLDIFIHLLVSMGLIACLHTIVIPSSLVPYCMASLQNGQTPLHKSVKMGHYKVTRLLTESKADIYFVDKVRMSGFK
jgi:hypothetical protein